jgi:hypothetical protein
LQTNGGISIVENFRLTVNNTLISDVGNHADRVTVDEKEVRRLAVVEDHVVPNYFYLACIEFACQHAAEPPKHENLNLELFELEKTEEFHVNLFEVVILEHLDTVLNRSLALHKWKSVPFFTIGMNISRCLHISLLNIQNSRDSVSSL